MIGADFMKVSLLDTSEEKFPGGLIDIVTIIVYGIARIGKWR
jgi:hypothetical protein